MCNVTKIIEPVRRLLVDDGIAGDLRLEGDDDQGARRRSAVRLVPIFAPNEGEELA
jgi:hypothetical protein